MSDPRAASNDDHNDSDDSMDAAVANTASFVVFSVIAMCILKTLNFSTNTEMQLHCPNSQSLNLWQKQWIPWENMEELSLVNCIISPGRELACVLGMSQNLEMIH
ncbi:hypothetical protein QUC31_003870 [Theobroma cacao]